ncbi:UvrD-helicase domain-containing protein [Thermoleophilia bacterium SCSIO 60948]|nr:UvrD-helicase domain-containing protein [Thermoleophilia bacterium SCSIO 60948]
MPELLRARPDLPPSAGADRGADRRGPRRAAAGEGVLSAAATDGPSASERPAPTPEQAAATTARGRDVLLEAGAGSGKTRVLVERYCDAAIELGSLEPIVAFTFTERAAGELRERVIGELERRARSSAAAGDAEASALAAELAASADEAWVSTIHGFCRRLIASHPFALGLDPGFRVLSEQESTRLGREAFETALDELLRSESVEDAAEIVAATRVSELASMVRTIHDELRALGREPRLEPATPADVAEAASRLREAATEALAETAEAKGKRAAESRERLASAAALGPAPTEGEIADLMLKTKAAAFLGPCCEDFRSAFDALRGALADHAALGLHALLARLVEIYARRLDEVKAERSGLDFEDLQLRAIELLETRPDVAGALGERLRHILVDEFQDTNPLQVRLVELIRGPETAVFRVGDEFQSIYGFRGADVEAFRAERERAREDASATVIGLRGNFRSTAAIVAAVNALGEAMLDGFVPLTVGASTAAQPGDGHEAGPEEHPEPDSAPDPQLSLLDPSPAPPPRRSEEPAVELLLTPETSDWELAGPAIPGDYPSSPARVAEARFLAGRLAELVKQGTDRGSIVVLLRAYTHVVAYEDALEAAGLRPYVVGGRGFWSAQQVDDVRRLLATIANPLDDAALLGALASPACGVRPETLWLLAAARREGGTGRLWPLVRRLAGGGRHEPTDAAELAAARLAAIADDERERILALHDSIERLRDLAPIVPLDELVDRTVTDTGYDLAVLGMDRGERRFANVRKLMRIARDFEAAEGRDLRGLLAQLAASADVAREGEAATAAERHDGVRVMTAHTAKGLEFHTVAVAELGRALLPPGRGPGARVERRPAGEPRVGLRLSRFGTKAVGAFGFDELAERAAAADSEESRRLAYVAATRAEQRLILSGGFKPSRLGRASSETALSAPVSERFMRALGLGPEPESGPIEIRPAELRPGLGGVAPLTSARVEVAVNTPPAVPEAEASGARPRPEPAGVPATIEPASYDGRVLEVATRAGGGAGHLSPSSLAAYERCGYRFWAERIVGLAPREPGGAGGPGGARGFGTAVHGLLEASAATDWRAPGTDEIAAALAGEGVEPSAERIERAAMMVSGWLEAPLARSLAGREQRAEVSFLLPIGRTVVRGTIDLLVLGDVPLVVDYKTDRVGSHGLGALVDRYGIQRELYALAARAASGADRVETAYVFLERPGEPVSLELGPDELDAAERRIEASLGRIGAGEFEVTPTPHAALCADCPARAALCSYEEIPDLPSSGVAA